MVVGYIVSLFPCWSETFILNEILALRERGVDLILFSLRPPHEKLAHAAALRLVDSVVYPRIGHSIFSFLKRLLRHPAESVYALWSAGREAVTGGLLEVLKALYTVVVAIYFSDVARRLEVTYLHAHWATYPALAARTIAPLLDCPYTVTTHAHDIFVSNPYLRRNLGQAQLVVTISQFNRDHLSCTGVPASKIRVIPCGIELKQFAEAGTRDNGQSVIAAVGRLEPIKGFPILIDACAELRRRGVQFVCHIAGDGSLRNELTHRIVTNGLETRVRLLGALEQDGVRGLLSRATIFVLPSVRIANRNQDGIPVSLMEAMAAGLPAVTTRVSGIPELITHEVSGLLVTPGSVGELADAMERLLGDASLRERLGVRARDAVYRRHDIYRSAALMHDVFIEAWRAHRDRR